MNTADTPDKKVTRYEPPRVEREVSHAEIQQEVQYAANFGSVTTGKQQNP